MKIFLYSMFKVILGKLPKNQFKKVYDDFYLDKQN